MSSGVFCQLHDLSSYNLSCDKRIWIYKYYSRCCCCFFTLPSEFQVIISGSKKQQQKDSYQSEVPFSVIPGRTPWKQRITRKQFTANLTRSAQIEFRMHLKSLFNKCRRTVILIPTKLCQDEQNKKKYSRPASKQDRFCQHKNLTDQCLKFL